MCDKAVCVCERWRVTKLCVAEREEEEEEDAEEERDTKSKQEPTQSWGKKIQPR